MYHDLIISGSGGQGALFAGQLLAYAAMDAGLQVTWMPSYGPEMCDGTAHCTVIVSDTPIGAPLVRNPQTVIALNRPSLDKYEPRWWQPADCSSTTVRSPGVNRHALTL
jgi:2-oxoglutarate ferredoxin oxidoreductase subunit gamma